MGQRALLGTVGGRVDGISFRGENLEAAQKSNYMFFNPEITLLEIYPRVILS